MCREQQIPRRGIDSATHRNNPINFTDPSGHDRDCGIGDQYCDSLKHELGVNWKDGLTGKIINTQKSKTQKPSATSPGSKLSIAISGGVGRIFLYGALELVQDNKGGIALFYTYRDWDFHSGNPFFPDFTELSHPGLAEDWIARVGPKDDYGIGKFPLLSPQFGVVIAGGRIYGSDFERNGVDAYKGRSIQKEGSVPFVGSDLYTSFDTEKNQPSLNVYGWDTGVSLGEPIVSGGMLGTNNYQIFKTTLSEPLLALCQLVYGCGG